MRSLRPTGWCRMSVRARPTNRFQDSPKGRQPVSEESDLARAFTHTLASSPSGVVDRQRATSILAAGSVRQLSLLRLVATFGGVHTPGHPITTVVAVWHDMYYLSRTRFCQGIPLLLEGLDDVHAVGLVPVEPVLVGRIYQCR
jgi:hypothetical protein